LPSAGVFPYIPEPKGSVRLTRQVAPPRWHREVEAEPAVVGELRRGVAEFARAHGAAQDALDNMTLAVSEAVTNAIIHAFVDRARGRISITAEAVEGSILVRVVDDGRGMTPHPDSPGLGLGLTMMASMASRCDIREGPGGVGTEVLLMFTTPGVSGPTLGLGEGDDRLELLVAVERLVDGGAWPDEGVDALVALLVPRVADACTLDVVDESGEPRRLAAHYEGPAGPEAAAFLAARRPTREQIAITVAALRAGRPRLITDVDPAMLRAIAHDDAEAERLASMDLAHWVNLPLQVADQLLGSLGLGLASTRPSPEEQLPFFEALAERAARGLANTQVIAELRRTRERLERILSSLAEAVTVHDERGKLVYANPAAARLLGAASVEELLAAEPGELAARFLITREDGTPVRQSDLPGQRLLAGEEAPQLLTRSVVRATGREYWLLTKATRLDDGGTLAVNIIEDVTEAKTAERRERFLSEAGALLGSTLDYEQTLQHVAALVVPTLADWCVLDLVEEGGGLQRVALAHADPDKRRLAGELHDRYPPDPAIDEGLGAVLNSGQPLVASEIAEEMLAAASRDDEHLRLLLELGMRSAMLVPLKLIERTMGVLTLVNSSSHRSFTSSDLAFAEELARRVATAVHNARLYRDRPAQ
jgi:PAS domain S-box-containing protein